MQQPDVFTVPEKLSLSARLVINKAVHATRRVWYEASVVESLHTCRTGEDDRLAKTASTSWRDDFAVDESYENKQDEF